MLLPYSKLCDFLLDAVKSAPQGHVHEFGLSVHLEAAHDGIIDFVVNDELLARVLGVGLEGGDNLRLLVGGEVAGGDDRDLLLLVERSVQFCVLLSNVVDLAQTLVLGEDDQETQSGLTERCRLLECNVELLDLDAAHATVLREEAELLTVGVDALQEFQVLIHVVQVTVL